MNWVVRRNEEVRSGISWERCIRKMGHMLLGGRGLICWRRMVCVKDKCWGMRGRTRNVKGRGEGCRVLWEMKGHFISEVGTSKTEIKRDSG